MRKLKDHQLITVLLPRSIIDRLDEERDMINEVSAPQNRITRIKLIRNILAKHYNIVL